MAVDLEQIRLLITGSADDFQNAVSDARRALNRIPNTTTKEFNLATGTAEENLKEIRRELEALDKFEADAEVKVAIAKALADVSLFEQKLRGIPREVNVDVDVKRDILSTLTSMQTGFGRLGKNIGAAEAPARTFTQVFFQIFFLIKSLAPLIASLTILLGVSLVSGIIAVASSLGAAVAGLAAFTAGLTAGLLPALVGVVAVFARFQKIMEAVQAANKAQDLTAKESTEGTREAAAAAEERTRREEALRDAQQAVVTSERGYRQAVTEARQAIIDANQRAIDSQADLANATRDLQETTVDAYDAMRQAAEDVEDAVRGIERAELGMEQAELATRRARLELEQFASEAGVAGDAFIKKITDVDIDPKDLAGVLEKVGADAGLDTEQQLEFEELALRLRQATLDEKDAVDQLDDSRTNLTKARREEAKFAREGIAAYEPYRAAIDRVAQAEREAGRAARDAARLRKLGVDQAPAVVAAYEGLRDAQERLTASERAMRPGQALTAAEQAAEDATSAFSQLSAAEQDFAKQIVGLGTYLREFFKPITDAVFGGLANGARAIPALLEPLKPAFAEIGAAFADVIATFGAELIKPATMNALRVFTEQAAVLVRILGSQVFLELFRIFLRLGQLALPMVVFLLQELAGWLSQVRAGLDTPAGANFISVVLESFRVWMKLIGAVLGLLVQLFTVVAPFGDELVSWITDAIKGFTEWLKTAEGQERVKEFFRDTIPAVKSMIGFIARLVRIFLQIMQFLGPISAGFHEAFNPFLDLISLILEGLLKIPAIVRFAFGAFLAFGSIGRIIGGLLGLIGRLPNVIARLPRAVQAVITPIGEGFATIGRFIATLGRRILTLPLQVGRMAVAFVARLVRLARDSGSVAGRIATAIFNGIGRVIGFLGRLIEPVVKAGRRIVEGLVGVFRNIGERVRRLLGAVVTVVRDIINGVISLINHATDLVNKATPGDINLGPLGTIPGVPDIPKIPQLAAGGLVTGATAALLGEGGDKEAVLPLNKRTLGELAKALSRFMQFPAPTFVMAGPPRLAAAGGGSVRGDLNVTLPPAPAAAVPDARHQAAQLGQEMRRRGW